MLITDLTRMQNQHICVAGIDLGSGKRVRPVLAGGAQFSLDMARHHGGPFDIRRVVDLGETKPVPSPPEIEDVEVSPSAIRRIRLMPPPDFLTHLSSAAIPNAQTAIGPALKRHLNGTSMVCPEGQGECSLAIQLANKEFQVTVDGFGRLRAAWANGINLSITDLRLYEADGATPDQDEITALQKRLAAHFSQSRAVYIAFGLTRPVSLPRTGDATVYHWLQVNSIHLEDNLSWRLPKLPEGVS
ncbi:MAG: hypothetical protein C3F10_12175 [Dehalococcoidia bacterium]|nr:MAG: hypothetical protein C3F10_12175 [Dehalococcoidia bacterium]